MDDLVQFLRARLDEDYEAVQVVLGVNVMAAIRHGQPAPRWVPSPNNDVGVWDTNRQPRVKYAWPRERDHIIRHDPARVLAETEAKRQLVEKYAKVAVNDIDEVEYAHGYANALGEAMRLMALPYADHPDYNQAWRP
jgi:hypothetical protein